jgi:uncharacterized membrane protein
MAQFVYFIFKFEPPTLDATLKGWLRTMSLQEIREYLRCKNKQEWAEARAKAWPFVILDCVVIVLCVIGDYARVTGIWETLMVFAMVGIFLQVLSGFLGAISLWEYQFRRQRWFQKAKSEVEKEFIKTS